ncbi:hypothetical protein DP120_06980 [Planococcus halotolerans]|uniref:Uncharacterized protein n=1 Tax=Planococcus halotolerans TaxID=2233542 RepID=A0A365L1N6_9BACL|nr:hypothetical protein DP120_06980 [Planococcus halotolerans]
MAHLGSRNKPRRALVFAPSAFACSIGAPALREVSRDMEQNSEELTDACEGNSLRRSSAAMQEHGF